MISSITGEVTFTDGFCFSRHIPLSVDHLKDASSYELLPVPGWSHHGLGIHPSDYGQFQVEAVSDRDCRIQVVLLAHAHPFYQTDTPDDAERRVFHESIIAADLLGQREFSWGEVFCHFSAERNRDWLVVAYTAGPPIPLHHAELLRHLSEHEPWPDRNDS